MKTHIWNYTETFPGAVNFIDTNNVVLGYRLDQSCCENAFWSISAPGSEEPIHKGDDQESFEVSLDGYTFDPDYFQQQDDDSSECYVAVFRLVRCKWHENQSLPEELFIRLENHHNGYYGHGFTFRGNKVIEGVL